MSTSQTTIVRGHDVKFLRSFAMNGLFGAFANPHQPAVIEEFCFMNALILYLWIGNAYTLSLIEKICLLRVWFEFEFECRPLSGTHSRARFS